MKKLFQQSRFFNIKLAISLTVLFLAIVLVVALCLPWHQKYNSAIEIITSEGDERVMDDIILDGIISKNGYQTSFSVTGQALPSQIKTNTLTLEPRSSFWRFSNIPEAFQNELFRTEALLDETNSNFLIAEGAKKTLIRREQLEEETFGEQGGEREIYENVYQPDFIVPAFCFLDMESIRAGWYRTGSDQQIRADYTIAPQENGWEMEYSQRECIDSDNVNMDDTWQEDAYWKSQTIPDAPTCTNLMQLSVQWNGENYVTLPTLTGAVGQNGIYRMTPTQGKNYIGYSQVSDLNDSSIRADYMAQRAPIYTYDIQTVGAPDCLTCGMILHKDMLFLLTAQILEHSDVEDAMQTAQGATDILQNSKGESAEGNIATLTLTAVDLSNGAELDTIELGSYALQEECPPMLYQNENYLSVGIAIASGAHKDAPEYGGFTVLSFAFDAESGIAQVQTRQAEQESNANPMVAQNRITSKTGALKLCDTTTFIQSAFGDTSCLQDVYFDGNTLFLMETSIYYTDENFDPNTVYNPNFLGRYLTQRMMAFQGGKCVWQGYLSTDVYQDALRNYYESWSSERVVSNLKFHKESEVRS